MYLKIASSCSIEASRFSTFAAADITLTFPFTYPFELSTLSKDGLQPLDPLLFEKGINSIPKTGQNFGTTISDSSIENSIPKILALSLADLNIYRIWFFLRDFLLYLDLASAGGFLCFFLHESQ